MAEREFLITPLPLQSKELPDLNFGKVLKLYFYENWNDEEYKANLKKEHLAEDFKTDEYLINFGQNFSKFYVGYITADFENQTFWGWQGETVSLGRRMRKFWRHHFQIPILKGVKLIVFTPTRPSDFNLGYIDANDNISSLQL